MSNVFQNCWGNYSAKSDIDRYQPNYIIFMTIKAFWINIQGCHEDRAMSVKVTAICIHISLSLICPTNPENDLGKGGLRYY